MAGGVQKIGICGGTFDPIHTGHLAVAELVRCEFGLDKVLFIPSGRPPHKDLSSVTEPVHRLNMVKCATGSNSFFEAESIEIDRVGFTYTADTLKELHKKYPAGTKFYFIIGADVVMDLQNWRNYQEVFGLTAFIAVMRPGYREDKINTQIDYLKDNYDLKISGFEIPLLDISSTFIRERVKRRQSIKYLVSDCVEEYIKENKLYL